MIGAHLSKSNLASEIITSTSDIAQIFISNPRSYQPPKQEDIARINEIENQIIVHLPYLVNIPSATVEVREKSAQLLTDTLKYSGRNLTNFVVHAGQGGIDSSLEEANGRWVQFIKSHAIMGKMLIENTAGGSSAPGKNLENLVDLILDMRNFADVGVCFDTCHAYAAGYDDLLVSYNYLKDRLGRVDLVHLNDSKDPLGSNRDRHELLFNGTVGRANLEALIGQMRADGVDVILETPGDPSVWASEIASYRNIK